MKEKIETENRIWFIERNMLTGDDAEKYLQEQNEELIKLKDYLLRKLKMLNELINFYNIKLDNSYSSYSQNVLELSEILSTVEIEMEIIIETLKKHNL